MQDLSKWHPSYFCSFWLTLYIKNKRYKCCTCLHTEKKMLCTWHCMCVLPVKYRGCLHACMHVSVYSMYEYKCLCVCMHVCMYACVYCMYKNYRCSVCVCTHCDYINHFKTSILPRMCNDYKYIFWNTIKIERWNSLPAGIINNAQKIYKHINKFQKLAHLTLLRPPPITRPLLRPPPNSFTPLDRNASGKGTREWIIIAYSAEKQNKECGPAWICWSWSWVGRMNLLAFLRFLPWVEILVGGNKWLVLGLSTSPLENLRQWYTLLSLSLSKLHCLTLGVGSEVMTKNGCTCPSLNTL